VRQKPKEGKKKGESFESTCRQCMWDTYSNTECWVCLEC